MGLKLRLDLTLYILCHCEQWCKEISAASKWWSKSICQVYYWVHLSKVHSYCSQFFWSSSKWAVCVNTYVWYMTEHCWPRDIHGDSHASSMVQTWCCLVSSDWKTCHYSFWMDWDLSSYFCCSCNSNRNGFQEVQLHLLAYHIYSWHEYWINVVRKLQKGLDKNGLYIGELDFRHQNPFLNSGWFWFWCRCSEFRKLTHMINME